VIGTALKKLPGVGKALKKLIGSGDDAAKAFKRNAEKAVERKRRVEQATPPPRKPAPRGSPGGASRTVTALTREQDVALQAAVRDPNKIRHIFGKAEHNLGPLTKDLGSREAVLRDPVLAVPRTQTGKFEVTKRIGRNNLTVRGRVVDGVPRIGTVFVP
jgi:hypothetical protein